jgi:hypothetical protein
MIMVGLVAIAAGERAMTGLQRLKNRLAEIMAENRELKNRLDASTARPSACPVAEAVPGGNEPDRALNCLPGPDNVGSMADAAGKLYRRVEDALAPLLSVNQLRPAQPYEWGNGRSHLA